MSRYLNYEIVNTEPLSIVDMYHSKSDEAVALSYITGSTMRGMIMSHLAAEEKLECYKEEFFNGNIRFLNAYPAIQTDDGYTLTMPTPKGFYENRTSNGPVLHAFVGSDELSDENPLKGMKRAKTGVFAAIKGENILYMSPEIGETFKLRMTRNVLSENKKGKKQQIFRGDYIEKGHVFCGSIFYEDSCSEELMDSVKDILEHGFIKIGNARNAGYGRIKVLQLKDSSENPYTFLSEGRNRRKVSDGEETEYIVDMLCLSSLCMTNEYGEPCGINEKELAESLGCTKVRIINASSSVTQFSSYNRMRGGRSEQIPVFEAGSIFRLSCSKEPDFMKMLKLEDTGIGKNRNEGFGRIIFVHGIESISNKISASPYIQEEDFSNDLANTEVFKKDMTSMFKKCSRSMIKQHIEKQKLKYILNHEFKQGTASKSQRGTVLMMCKNLYYHPNNALNEFTAYFDHIEDKERRAHVNSKNKGSQLKMKAGIMEILEGDIVELLSMSKVRVFGNTLKDVINEEEEMRIKLQLLEDMIRYANRKEISSGR